MSSPKTSPARLTTLLVQGRLRGFARETVGAVYRAALHAANEPQDEGLEWLRSEAGIAYRRLAENAYDALPGSIRDVPVGQVKAIVSGETFVELVEAAFREIAELAERLEMPEELPQG